MPMYLYRCPNKHEINVTHGMTEAVKVFCPMCGEVMRRKPQVHAVKWSSFIEPSHPIREHLATLGQQREAYQEKHGD